MFILSLKLKLTYLTKIFRNSTIPLYFSNMCAVKQYGETVSQVGTSFNPVQFFKRLHSHSLPLNSDLLRKLLSLYEMSSKSSLV